MTSIPAQVRVPATYIFDGLGSDYADFNSWDKTIDDSTTTYTLVSLPANAELVKLKYNISATFNGTIKLGNASVADAYIADALFPKSGSGVILINALLTSAQVIKLAVSGCTTGAGWFKFVWEVN